jgi:glutamyl-tRNA synthetase
VLQEKRQAAEAAGGGWVYDRTCCALTADEIARREAAGEPRAVRFKVPPGQTAFVDAVHGSIAFENANIEDFVILRSDRQPTYHLSVVADDVDMAISHVVRGDDHISNTPKQILIYQAVGAPLPQFAHLPLILGPDKKRLSKRHGATSVMEYERQGYLPEAMVNFLALLGWSPGGDREIFSREDLASVFGLDGIGGGNAVFNPEKLDWFNQQHIARLAPDELAVRLKPWLDAAGLWDHSYLTSRHGWLFAVLELLRPRAHRLDDFVTQGRFFFTDTVEYDEAAIVKYLLGERMAEHLGAVDAILTGLADFEPVSIEKAVRSLAEERSVKAATLIHGIRVAITGKAVSPGLFEVVALVGRDRTRARLRAAVQLIAAHRPA